MLSLIHTPIAAKEAILALRISIEWYKVAAYRGALCRSYSDHNDLLQRHRSHNVSDLLHFSVLLTLGWPEHELRLLQDRADYLFDIVAEAWEKAEMECSTLPALNGVDRTNDFKQVFKNHVGTSPEISDALDTRERESLLARLNSICDTVALIVSRSERNRRDRQSDILTLIEA